ncbi:GRAM domain family protein, putative isoform 1 [Quillaja saponaria]|uniref:GRAM domain family protein, putative isoform 1 n=1 Tax=Quillaja saponaria TaxID=32244 RepID=A0AAD7LPD7_QUISA|nr:GRAM domain family protein, putative isoform 1 [Quillaja saponaria]
MAMASASAQRSEPSKPMDPSPSKLATDTANDSSLSSPTSTSNGCETPGRSEQSIFSPDPRKDIVDVKSPAELRSEEYRQLFRLPAEEVLIEDFNCAFQENILIQGHMYLFVHFICFYSNIFGFETKKIIPFHEVTTVRRAKTAGIFPNAIEVHAIDKKYFFASFLSRDEAFKIINDGWTQHGNGAKAITERQEPISDSVSQEYGFVAIEKVKGSKGPDNESRSTDMNKDSPTFEDLGLPSNVQDDPVLTTVPEQQISVEQGEESVLHETSRQSWIWKEENIDAPNVPEFYTSVAESRFSIRVEDFFRYFFSDDDVNFNESYHKRCGDKDFKCTTWHPHEKFGYAREVSFNHPIKIYLGAKLGGCQEVQKFRVYRNSHLVIETSQEVSDVPYADYFRVEGLWDIQRDTDESKECCILRIYVNVAFSKKTIWKGKIVQSTVEECRDAYAIWIGMAHELLKKQKSQEKQEGAVTSACVVQKGEVHLEREANGGESSERMHESSNATRTPHVSEICRY